MKYKSKLKLFACAIFLLHLMVHSVKASTSFIVAGHLYGITDNSASMEKLVSKFESLNPDYVFILGDSSLDDVKIYNFFNNKFRDKIYFSPGNHEIVNASLKKYIANVGYTYKTVESENVRFVIINSLDSVSNINDYLKKSLRSNSDKLQIIMTHHRIWDDSLMSDFPYQHDKSYYFEEIYPLISKKVKAIFSGNSSRQYFLSRYEKSNDCQFENVNNVYWVDKVGDIKGYSIGASKGKIKVGFVYVEENNGKLQVEPHQINFEEELVPISRLCASKNSVKPINNDSIYFKILWPVKRFFQSQRKQTVFLIGVFLGILVIFLLNYLFFAKNKMVKFRFKK
jgi:hypothetical protein